MSNVVSLLASDGRKVKFVDEIKAQGGMKDIYFSPDRRYVVAFLRTPADEETRERLQMICHRYRDNIFEREGGEYWQKVFCWPTAVVEHNGRLGVVVPFYRDNFFFQHGSINNDAFGFKGEEKEGKWFASLRNRQCHLDARELGDWRQYLRICTLLAQAIRRMHMAGLSHSDLGYKNCLIDPIRAEICLIDLDGLVVPGKLPPQVAGTPDFFAPEVIATQHLAPDDPRRHVPSRATDLHALAVLIYMYLLYRHPLRGGRVLSDDPEIDDRLNMGEQALFIEDPNDTSNRFLRAQLDDKDLTWALPFSDPQKIPYTVTGSYLSEQFQKAFITGLHQPDKRPEAADWEDALIKTQDLLLPCDNKKCPQKWFVFNNSTRPVCPFCGTKYHHVLPVCNLYSPYPNGKYRFDDYRVAIYDGLALQQWHVDPHCFPNERFPPEQRHALAHFQWHKNAFYLHNDNLPQLLDVSNGQRRPVPIGDRVALRDGMCLLFGGEKNRLAMVQVLEKT